MPSRSVRGTISILSQPGIKEFAGQRLLIFHCQNQPGQCEEWAPDSGGNRAIIVDIDIDIDVATTLHAPGLRGWQSLSVPAA